MSGIENKLIPTFIFLIHFSTLILFGLTIVGKVNLSILATILLIKMASEYLFIHKVMMFLGNKAGILYYLIASLIYPFYAVFVGLTANFVGYIWKGRKYKRSK